MPTASSPEPVATGDRPRIGIFDSGVGGLSVLKALHDVMGDADLHYLADSGHAPYGERDANHVVERAMRIARHLVDRGAQAIVIACNTATALAVQPLREAWPGLPIIGVEPGLKPALAISRNGCIGVMATTTTLSSDKFRRLLAMHAQGKQIHLQACVGLAAAIERGDLDAPELLALIAAHCQPLRAAGVDTVVLGCTHYPFVAPAIQVALGPQVQIVDTAGAVARRVAALVAAAPSNDRAAGLTDASVWLETTGDLETLQSIARSWLPFDCHGGEAPLEV